MNSMDPWDDESNGLTQSELLSPPRLLPWPFKSMALVFVGFLGVQLVLGVLFGVYLAVMSDLSNSDYSPSELEVNLAMLVVTFVSYGVLIVLIRRLVRNSGTTWKDAFGLETNQLPKLLPIVFIVFLGVMLFSLGFTSMLGEVEDPTTAIFKESAHSMSLAFFGFLLVIVIGAPVFEEFLFRGLLYQSLTKYMNQWAAMFVSSSVFVFWHFLPVALWPQMFVLSLALTLVYRYTQNLWAAILLHAINNTLAVIVALLTLEQA